MFEIRQDDALQLVLKNVWCTKIGLLARPIVVLNGRPSENMAALLAEKTVCGLRFGYHSSVNVAAGRLDS